MDEQNHQSHDASVIEIDGEGWMHGEGVGCFRSDQEQALWTGETHVLGIVWHYTDTRSVGAANLARRIVRGMEHSRAASWHVCVDRQGAIAQSVSMLRGSWHAGGATAARFGVACMEDGHRVWGLIPSSRRDRPGANSLFSGIELENVGELRLIDGEWLGWPFKRGLPSGAPIAVPEAEVHVEGNGKAHHSFTAQQVAAALRVTSALAHKYNLIKVNCEWSHQDIDPEHRTDPGPVWMGVHLPEILSSVFGSK